ncbi:hypothetical protein [Prochlorococcus sp. MIT 1223]|uniref:hypothetical protein n=1 Tax=Prochlorococcus sp. MIT 1223 TaxID=3096217 RepID=UPI002A747B55|nr:hypothetical protein [Prochlorococcus sp. MIT 1223]
MAINLKAFIKQILPVPALGLISNIYNRASAPYSLKSSIVLPSSISDFFAWNPYIAKTEFIAENIRALLLGSREKVTHCFKFFSEKGDFLWEEKYTSDDFFSRIILSGPPNSSSYSSFIHYVESKNSLYDLVKEKFQINNLVCEQNRGYCIYYPNLSSSVGSSIHGNFGSISRNGKLLARTRTLHLYSPAYRFESQNTYDLVFNNPTPSEIKIRILFNNEPERNKKMQINSLGTESLRLDGYSGSLTFESRLPICRSVIFKNVTKSKLEGFDVLHS